ncbi:MAG TPA: hypothetical protein VGK73_25280 [Polyangiaceae bacterium]
MVIAGGPRSGKSWLTDELKGQGHRIHDGEELRLAGYDLGPDASLAASRWLDEPGPWICENIIMPRALRKWLLNNPDGAPADLVIWTNDRIERRAPGQESMAVGCATVWRGVVPLLREREVQILNA